MTPSVDCCFDAPLSGFSTLGSLGPGGRRPLAGAQRRLSRSIANSSHFPKFSSILVPLERKPSDDCCFTTPISSSGSVRHRPAQSDKTPLVDGYQLPGGIDREHIHLYANYAVHDWVKCNNLSDLCFAIFVLETLIENIVILAVRFIGVNFYQTYWSVERICCSLAYA
jgi:hypothetical protein